MNYYWAKVDLFSMMEIFTIIKFVNMNYSQKLIQK